MYLVRKEKDNDYNIRIVIYDVEGRFEYERAHAGSDYEFLVVTKNKANKILTRELMCNDNKVFNKIEDAVIFAKKLHDEENAKIQKRFDALKIEMYI